MNSWRAPDTNAFLCCDSEGPPRPLELPAKCKKFTTEDDWSYGMHVAGCRYGKWSRISALWIVVNKAT
jgi:hypothetical protein